MCVCIQLYIYVYIYIFIYVYIIYDVGVYVYMHTTIYLNIFFSAYDVEENLCIHSENSISYFFQIERITIVVTVFLLIMKQIWVRLVQNEKENCNYNHIPINLKGLRNVFVSVYIYTLQYRQYISILSPVI